jgi:hypothetical protein
LKIPISYTIAGPPALDGSGVVNIQNPHFGFSGDQKIEKEMKLRGEVLLDDFHGSRGDAPMTIWMSGNCAKEAPKRKWVWLE